MAITILSLVGQIHHLVHVHKLWSWSFSIMCVYWCCTYHRSSANMQKVQYMMMIYDDAWKRQYLVHCNCSWLINSYRIFWNVFLVMHATNQLFAYEIIIFAFSYIRWTINYFTDSNPICHMQIASLYCIIPGMRIFSLAYWSLFPRKIMDLQFNETSPQSTEKQMFKSSMK